MRLLPWLPLAILLTGATAASQQPQPPARERQERQVVVPNNPDDPVPEVRVAANVATLFVFDAPIDRGSLEVEGRATRFNLMDIGERTITLEPAVEPGGGEKLGVRVRYKDVGVPAYATLALVSHPTRVDTRVDVMRRPRTLEALEAALAEKDAQLAALRAVSGPAGLVFSGRLDLNGVQARRIENLPTSTQSGLKVLSGEGYRARSWALAVIRVQNLPGQKPWESGQARLTRRDGTPVKVRSVDMNKAQLAPGEEGLIAVETEAPFWKVDGVLRLELLDKSGSRHLSIPNVKL
ncbi:MAG TPA: DUF2381 family protein [Archangium sp.]|uniref:DUF2381 family protein n=1 Tax=Archangium sp. TaxID=1872627 RepID=UPI002E37BCE1|nr:DUF2381 family protein [Archangium sp.]HEX5747829.1 DUF2381 family protein [Archangium sp.]